MPRTTLLKTSSKKVTSGQVNPKDDASIVQFVKDRWEKRAIHRQHLERQWYINIAQYKGHQYHYFDDASGQMRLSPAPPWRVRLVVNRLQPVVRKIVSKALRQQPQWTSIPATGENEDAQVSLVATKVLQYYWRWLDMDRKLVDAFYWMATTGNVFLSVFWDPNKGPEMQLSSEDREEIVGQLGEKFGKERLQKSLKSLRLGDLEVRVHSPFSIDPDPDATNLQDATYLIDSTARTLDWIHGRYGKKAKGIIPDANSDSSTSRHFEKRIQRIPNVSGGFRSGGADQQEKDSAVVHTLWMDPSPQHPGGVYAVVAGGRLLEKQIEIPNPFKKKPYVHLGEIPVPGQLWHTCALETAIPIQASYNKGRSQVIENINLMGRPKWFVPKGAGIKQSNLNNQPGEVIEHVPGLRPESASPDPLPEYIMRRLDMDVRDIDDVTAIHEVSQAKGSPGARSGIAIATLQEQDDQMLAPTFMLASRELGRLGGWALQLVAENVPEERMLKLVGKDKEVESFAFTGKSLLGPNKDKPGVNYFDVEVQLGSQLPFSKQARLQFVIDLVNNGILDPTPGGPDRTRIFKMLEIGSEEGQLQADSMDRQNARRANLSMMETGQPIPVYPWDNVGVHLEELRQFQKLPDFVANASEQVMEAFETRALQLELKLQELQGALPQDDTSQPLPPEEVPPEAELPTSEEEAIELLNQQGAEIPAGLTL